MNMYTEIPLVLANNDSVLGFPVLFTLPLIWYSCKLKFYKSDIKLLIIIYITTLVSVIVSVNFAQLPNYIIKIGQFYLALITGITTYRVTEKISLSFKRKSLLVVVLFMAIGIVFESVNLFYVADISNFLRKILYEGGVYGIYDAEARDIDIVGFERPKFFASEPSLVAFGYFIFSTCYLLVNDKYWHFWFVLLLDILVINFTGSPTALLTLVAWIWIFSRKVQSRWPLIAVVSALLLACVSFVVSPEFVTGKLVTRFLVETINPYTSLYSRLYVPYFEALPAAIRYNPLLGVGFAGKDLLISIGKLSFDSEDMQFILGTNAFARLFTFFGLGGMSILIYCFYRYLIENQIFSLGTILLMWFLFSQMIGAMETPRYWMYFFLVIELSKHFRDSEKIKAPHFRISV